MRLIDADALVQKVNERYHDPFFDVCVRNAPTIDPTSLVKRGRWVEKENGILFAKTVVCSECGYDLMTSGSIPKYCGNCGAMMEDL